MNENMKTIVNKVLTWALIIVLASLAIKVAIKIIASVIPIILLLSVIVGIFYLYKNFVAPKNGQQDK